MLFLLSRARPSRVACLVNDRAKTQPHLLSHFLLLSLAAFLLCGALGSGCHKSPDENLWAAGNTRLRLPKKPGWQRDSDGKNPLGQGGVLLRLTREGAVAGSPRIDVVTTRGNETPLDLEAYLAKNLGEMTQLETSGQIHILHVEQHRTWVADVPAYRLHHEYTLGAGNQQVSLYQVSTCLLLDGRGITVTAAGRTELFHPLARAVADVIDSLSLAPGGKQAQRARPAPVNLGRIGGEPKQKAP